MKKDEVNNEKSDLAQEDVRNSSAIGIDAIVGNTAQSEAEKDNSVNNDLEKCQKRCS